MASELVGNTREELEADAAAKAAIIQMLSPVDMNAPALPEPEPAIEGLAPRDKPIGEYTDAELEAQRLSLERTLREQERRRDEQRQQADAEAEAEANRTPEQRHGDGIASALTDKHARNRALVASLHPQEGDE